MKVRLINISQKTDSDIFIPSDQVKNMKKRTIVIGSVAVLILVLAVISVAIISYITNFSKPETSVTELDVLGVDEDLGGFTIELVLDIYNPNPLELEIISVEGTVEIDSTSIGDIYNATGLKIPGKQSKELSLVIHIDDVDSKIISGETLSAEGTSTARYLGREGNSEFQETMDLDLPFDGRNVQPVAIIIGPHNARPLEEIVFDGSTSMDSDGSITKYSWELGDDTDMEGEEISHRYTSVGVYTVTLTVTDDDDSTATASHQIVISAL